MMLLSKFSEKPTATIRNFSCMLRRTLSILAWANINFSQCEQILPRQYEDFELLNNMVENATVLKILGRKHVTLADTLGTFLNIRNTYLI
jgi:hypothetical protein